MTTEVNAPLAIPTATVQGIGGYTVPVDRYGYICANVLSQTHAWTANVFSGGNYTVSAAPEVSVSTNSNTIVNKAEGWLVAGDSITTNIVAVSVGSINAAGSGHATYNGDTNLAQVLLNAVLFCHVRSRGAAVMSGPAGTKVAGLDARGEASWSVSEYRIPKENLSVGLAVGE